MLPPERFVAKDEKIMLKKTPNFRKYLLGLLIINIAVFSGFFVRSILAAQVKTEEDILLLNANALENEPAVVKYILWTEETNELPRLEKFLSGTGLKWSRDILSNYYGNKAYKFTAAIIVNKENEKDALTIYKNLQAGISGQTVKTYFEETINKGTNLELYFQGDREIIQKIELAGLTSATGYSKVLDTDYFLNKKKGNFEILTRNGGIKKNTVLAIPALIEEF